MEESGTELAAEAPRGWDRAVVTLPVLGFLSLIGGQLPSYTTRANVYTICLGGAMLWLGVSGRARRPLPPPLGRGTSWWLVPIGIFGVFEGSTFLLGSTPDFPTFSRLADPLLKDELIRSAGYFAWLTSFWALVRR
ncbi:hypothetical protein O7635_17485 [Asanoa sp. WMMD1127]|uniref:hypothetical protein n=1 Tax=Asanoa sp. WMMD1127 TaxID=3016107 RepID=UPI00241751E0|nr:hypothetical protein [Asanoa sp. WMMD1127]MDG4823650.1 hypothetical protein [Asanoa sp. WMMD1127]